MPGMVRMSFGCYNDTDDVDRLVDMLERISRGEYAGKYAQDEHSGDYTPEGYHAPLADYFLLDEAEEYSLAGSSLDAPHPACGN
jgi:hypothetical protein